MVTRHTGGLSQLPVVKMKWENNSKIKPRVLTNFHFLDNFIRHTGPMVTMVMTSDQVHRWPISVSSGRNELGKKSKKKSAKVSGIKSAGAAKGAKEAKV